MAYRFWMAFRLAGLLAALTMVAQAQPSQDSGNDLPEGEQKGTVAGVCTQCHSLERITSSRHTLPEWADIVKNMVADGATLKEEEIEKVTQYLASHFGPGNSQAQPPERAGSSPAQPSAFKPVANVYQLMKAIIIPASDVIWHVAMEEPKDSQEWAVVQNNALTLAEAGNLLMIGRRAKDQGNWMKASQALIDGATLAFKAAEARDVSALNAAGDQLVRICANCHRQYKQSPPR